MNEQRRRVYYPNLLEVSLPILQGLLASGAYVIPPDENNVAEIARKDMGGEWNDGEPLWATRYPSVAVEDAISLAKELIDQVAIDKTEGPINPLIENA